MGNIRGRGIPRGNGPPPGYRGRGHPMPNGRGGPMMYRGGRGGPPPNMMRGRGGPPPNMMRGRGGPPPGYNMIQRGRGGAPPVMMYRGRGGPPPNMMRGGRGGPPPMFRGRGGPMRGGPPPNLNRGGFQGGMSGPMGLPPPDYSDEEDNNEVKESSKQIINNEVEQIDPEVLKSMGIDVTTADPETLKLITQMLQAELCGKCKKNQGFELSCGHKLCSICAKQHILRGIGMRVWKKKLLDCPIQNCGKVLPDWILKRAELGTQYLKEVEDMQREYLLASDDSMTQCPSCKDFFVTEKGDVLTLNKNEKGLDGKLLNNDAKKHKLEHRFRCAKCNTIFCKSCKTTPYHLGYTCKTWKTYKESSKCRFCEVSLTIKNKSIDDDDDLGAGLRGKVCNNEECLEKKKVACDKLLQCGHNCIGLRGKDCIKCINPKCVKNGKVTDDDFCNICWVDALFAAPTLKLECGHYFHFKCVWDKLSRKWPAARITFGFLNCPLCKQEIHDDSLTELIAPFYKLKTQIAKDAVERLKIEGLQHDKRLKDPNSPYYNNINKFAMDRLAFYKCFKCTKPYFGGMKACEEAGLEQEEKYVQEHLVCGSCASGPNTKSCKKHGKKYITYKCKFCCSISQWYCWGSTHFCDACHKKQEKGDYLNRKPISELPKCPGKDKCPLGIEHPPNGVEEFSLGCVVCLRK